MKPQVLIVEDNFMLSSELAEIVEKELNASTIIVSTVSEALEAAAKSISLALLDIEIVEGNSYPVARLLLDRKVPLIFVSGNAPESLPDDLRNVPFIPKPCFQGKLVFLAKSLCSEFC